MKSLEEITAIYSVELLFESPPILQKRVLLESLRTRCPGVKPLDDNPDSGPLAFAQTDYEIPLAEGSISPQIFIAVSEKSVSAADYMPAIEQSWRFPEASERVQRCTTTVLMTDLFASPLDHRVRLDLFQRSLTSVLEVLPCAAIHWVPTQQILDPDWFLGAYESEEIVDLFAGALNVRFFNIADTDDEMLMDTLGLSVLGLPDVQCHFRLLDPNEVARVLYSAAFYLFESGDVIEDDSTIEGIEPGSKWRCQHEASLVPPERVVLDLNPGAPYAAGQRFE